MRGCHQERGANVGEWFKDWFDGDYAAIYEHRDESEAEAAVAMALDQAPALATGPVLDLACGSGRHLAVLRRHNPLAFGLDLSRELLALAADPLRPWLLRGDMRALPFRDASLAGICLWFTPFGYFGDDQNRALLQRLRALLRPGGTLVMDYLNAPHMRKHLVSADVALHPGLHVASRRTLEGHRLVKHMTLTRLETGATRQVKESVRIYEPEDLRALAAQSGLTLRHESGDYLGAAFDLETSPRWIGFLTREDPN